MKWIKFKTIHHTRNHLFLKIHAHIRRMYPYTMCSYRANYFYVIQKRDYTRILRFKQQVHNTCIVVYMANKVECARKTTR